MKQLAIVMFAATLAGGCGSSSPAEKCDDWVDLMCDRLVECFPGQGTHTACVQEAQSALSCGSIKSVSSTYSRCMDQIGDFSCAALFPVNPDTGQQELVLPADCVGVFSTLDDPGGGDDDGGGSFVGGESRLEDAIAPSVSAAP